jgi:F-type H+-transporting ATPase subunit alpha
MPVEEQVVSIYAGTNGYLDDIPANDVRRFETELLDYFRTRRGDILSAIKSTGAMPEEGIGRQLDEFKASFVPSDGSGSTTTTLTDAEAVGAAESEETLATE